MSGAAGRKAMQIGGERAQKLAEELAAQRNVSIGQAVEQALEEVLKREAERRSLTQKLRAIAADLASLGEPGGRAMRKDEVDEMWGH